MITIIVNKYMVHLYSGELECLDTTQLTSNLTFRGIVRIMFLCIHYRNPFSYVT